MGVDIVPDQLRTDIAVSAHALHESFVAAPSPRFEALYETYRLLLRGIAIRKFEVPVRDAEDLVQDVFATYLANPMNIRNVHAYLVGAICNASRQYRRKERSTLLCESWPTRCAATPDDDLLNSVIGSVVLQSTLAQLGPSCRDTLMRFYMLGETTVAIAQSRDTSANYIARLLSYCRNRARSIYRRINRS